MFCSMAIAQTTVDLTNHEPTTPPAGTTVKWYTDANHTTAVTDKTAVGAGLYYAFLVDAGETCFQGPATLRVLENNCVATTADITTAAPTSGLPTGATVTYHSSLEPSSTNEITGTATTEAGAGTYYLAFRTGTAGNYCYSMGSPVVVIIKECPVAKNDIAQTPQDTPVSGDLLTNDTNITKVTSITVGGVTTAVPGTGTVDVTMPEGTLTIASDGTYTFTPTTGFTGQVPEITYEGEDANGNKDTAVLDIDVIPNPSSTSNTPPTANDDTNTVKQGGTVTTNVLANDGDPNGDPLTVKPNSMTGLSATGTPVVLTSTPQNVYDANGVLAGQASIDANGNLVFAADANYVGDVPFEYTAQDGKGGEATANVEITVTPSTAPNSTVANDDASVGPRGEVQTGNVLTNDSDPEGDAQTVKEIKVLDASGNEITVAAGTATDVYVKDASGAIVKAGNVTVNSDGTFSYTPEPNYVGTVPVKYVAQDTNGNTAMATLSLTTTETPPLKAKNDIAQTPMNTPVSGDLLTNDQFIDKVTSITVGGVTTTVPATGSVDVTMPEGTLTIKSDGTYTFTPTDGFTGPVPPITYEGEDANGKKDTAVLDIDVIPNSTEGTNTAPTANDDTNKVKQGGTVTTDVLANDVDPEGDALTVKPNSMTGLSATGTAVVLTSTPQNVYDANGVLAGQASIVGDKLVFTADANYIGDVPFDYTAQDGMGGESSAKVVITVVPSSTPNTTVANDDASAGEQGVAQTGNVLTNDYDPEGDAQTVKEIKVLNASGAEITVAAGTTTDIYDASGTKAGSLVVNSDGTFTYTPVPTYIGTVPVKYVAQDTNGNTATATLSLTTLPKPELAPVRLISFEAKDKIDFTLLTWATATELNNWKFEVMRSTDGVNFTKIGEVAGMGTTNEEQYYRFVDADVVSSKVIYYKLKQIDYDGEFEYSPIRTIERKSAADMLVYPNPISSATPYISVKNALDTDRYQVYDLLGKLVQEGNVTATIDLSGLTNGTYIIRVIDAFNSVKMVDKIIKE